MGRPPTRPGKLRDGFYIEVRAKGSKSGIKLLYDSLEEMKKAAMLVCILVPLTSFSKIKMKRIKGSSVTSE